MTADVQNIQTIREAYAALLVAAIESESKAQKVYEFLPSDLRGRYSVVAVDSAPSARGKQAQVTRVSSDIELYTHILVLYGADPIKATNSPTAGNNKVIQMADTSVFDVGDPVIIEDNTHYELATVTVVTEDVSITVGTLAYSYTTPDVYWWHPKLATNRLDLLEKEISDVHMDNDTTAIWNQLSLNGTPTREYVVIGGKQYTDLIMNLNFECKSD